MKVRKATLKDFEEIMKIYEWARGFMKETGNPTQWGEAYPSREMISDDIKKEYLYVVEDEGAVVCVFYFRIGEDESYKEIFEGDWINDKEYGVVHRIAAKPGKSYGGFALDWCFEECGNVRIDTHKDNIPMQRLLKKKGYTYCGIIYIKEYGERIAFQKTACIK